MEIRKQAENIFNTFINRGTVGQGAERTDKLGLEDRFSGAAGDVYESILKEDNNPALDNDPRPGFMSGDAGTLKTFVEQGYLSDLDKAAEELVGPTPDPSTMTEEQKAELRKQLQELVEAGVMTQEDVESIFNPDAQPGAPVSGTYNAAFTRENGNLKVVFETDTAQEHDIECFMADGNGGTFFLDVTDKGDHATVRGVRMGATEEYKEEMIIR